MYKKIAICRLQVFLAFVLTQSIAHGQLLPGSAEAEDDWRARASASSAVLYATNFDDVYLDGALDASRSGISSQADLHTESFENGGDPNNQNVTVNSSVRTSGRNSVEILTPSSAAKSGGGYFAFRPDGRSATAWRKLYVQFSVYFPKETLGYRYKLSDGATGQLKVINLGQYGSGQVVISHARFMGFPSVFINGSQGISSATGSTFSGNPWGKTVLHVQPGVDSENPDPIGSSNSKTEWLLRYGPLSRGLSSDMNLDYDPSNPYLFNRNQPSGYPDSRAATNGQAYVLDGWTTIEMYLEYNESNPKASTIRMWVAPYGEPPKLIIDEVGTIPFNTNTDNSWKRFELLSYDTKRQSEAGRPTLHTYYDEVIVSQDPINFPGGHGLDGSRSGSGSGSGVGSLRNVSAPPWVTAIEPGTWSTISLNMIDDVDPADDPNANPNFPSSAPWRGNSGQRAVISAWNGGVLAYGYGTHGGLIAYGGGHNDYYGSEVYAFDLATRNWKRLSDPYPGPFNWPYNNAEYPDGSAIPPHTFDYVNYHPATNSLVLMKGQTELGPPSNSTSVDIPHMFDLDTATWRRGPKNLDNPRLYSGGYSAYDSKRDLFWANGGSGAEAFASFDPDGDNGDGTVGSWKTYTRKGSFTDSQAEYDPNNDIIVVTVFRDDTRIGAIDLSNPNAGRVFLTQSGDIPVRSSAHGWSWSHNRAAMLYFGRGNGSNVYQFKHQSGDWRDGVWSWQNLTSSSNTLTPETTNNGIYSRFQVVTYADAEVVVMVSSTTGPVYAFRVPDSLRPNPPSSLN